MPPPPVMYSLFMMFNLRRSLANRAPLVALCEVSPMRSPSRTERPGARNCATLHQQLRNAGDPGPSKAISRGWLPVSIFRAAGAELQAGDRSAGGDSCKTHSDL